MDFSFNHIFMNLEHVWAYTLFNWVNWFNVMVKAAVSEINNHKYETHWILCNYTE